MAVGGKQGPFVFFFWHHEIKERLLSELLQNCVVRGFVVKSGDWRESAYWICTFSNSQWHVQAELGNGRCELNHLEGLH